MDVAVAEFHDCHKIVLPFRYFRFPNPQSDLLEKCNQVHVAHVFVHSAFIIVVMGCRDKVIRHHIVNRNPVDVDNNFGSSSMTSKCYKSTIV